ncbi:MAG: histone deacetylase [Planctomycetota bacterium]
MNTYLVYSDIYLEHDTGTHPENAERLRRTIQHLKKSNLWNKLTCLIPRAATNEEIAYIHSPSYIKSVESVAKQGGGYLDGDTPVSEKSYQSALYATGGVLTAVDKVINTSAGRSNALCLVRPPGHHSLPNQGMGFCLFNNVAIAARYAQKKHHLKKIAIIDWDLHHGNGTQDAFYDDDSVLFCSLHRYPYYPGSGSEIENGSGKGKGFTVNIPLPSNISNKEYLDKFSKLLDKIVKPFKPDFIFISAGFDTYKNDPLGGLELEIEDYASLTRIVTAVADECCLGRVVSTLEGGYDLQGLPLCIESHLSALVTASEQ